LRETEEETGLDPARVSVLGELPLYQTVTGFRIHPVVGWITPPFELRPDPLEVAEAFEVPLHYVLAPENHRRQSYRRGPVTRGYYVLPYQGRFIWGATASVIRTEPIRFVSRMRDQVAKSGSETGPKSPWK